MTKKIRLSAEDGSASYAGNITIPDPDIIQPEILEATNRKWADRARVEIGLEAPTGYELYTGRLWFDTTEGVYALKIWDGEKWVIVDGPVSPFGDGSLGVTLYVNGVTGSDIFVTDDYNSQVVPPITNQMVTAGYSQEKPFKTLARAAIEVARITNDNPGFNPEYYDRIVIMVAPGDQVVENAPATGTVSAWENGYVPDAAELQKFCDSRGGMILSRGVSVQGEDLRKSLIRPNYVPAFGGDITSGRSAIFRLTGGSYFFNFTFKDKLNYNETHHLLDCFAFTDINELQTFYNKVRVACSLDSASVIANPGETQIVAPQPDAPELSTDGIIGSSPYIFNCSVRSTLGLCGIHADGDQTTGFKSMVVAQFTGVSLQTDIRCWQYYDIAQLPGNPWVNYTSSDSYEELIKADPNSVRQNPDYISSHVRTLNNAVIQEVSVFAIGQGVHHWAESGSEITVTNSNSNFGGVASLADGYKTQSFPVDSDWEVNRIRPSTDMSDQTNNISQIKLGKVLEGVANDATTITLQVALQPGVKDPNTPLLLERDGYSLKEGDYIWIVNSRGPDYRAVLTEDPWTSGDATQITVQSAFVNEDGFAPGDLLSAGPPAIYWPDIAKATVYIRRVKDTRTVAQRQNALLLLNTSEFRTPIRDFVVQSNINGGRGIQASIPDSTLSTIATSVAINDDINSDVLIELRNNTGDTAWTSGNLYRTGETVQYLGKHWNCVVENSDLSFNAVKWSESFVHMPSEFDQEGYFKNSKPIIIFNKDTDGLSESLTLGYNFSDSTASDYAWRDDVLVRNQLRSATDYKGLYNFLIGMGFTEDQSHIILYPRSVADRDVDPSKPADTGYDIPAPDGAANDWAKWGIEFRRPSNIRLFGHAFEWAGFGNYTKAIPKYQQELSPSNIFTYYFTSSAGGRAYVSGFNEEGFVVTPRGLIDLASGEELALDAIGGSSDPDEITLPTRYEEFSIGNLVIDGSLTFEGGPTISGTPVWESDEDWDKTFEAIGPFGGVLPKLPRATETQEGVIRIATQDEANALNSVDNNIAITPATLPISTTTQEGVIRIATQDEANALNSVDNNIAITPATLPISTTTQQGIVELATKEETTDGIRDDVAVTPFGLSGAGVVPQGGIIMWSGTISAIPENWALCDGSEVDGIQTPDLRDRFIVGSGSSYNTGASGGPNFNGTVQPHSLTRPEIPGHRHGYEEPKNEITIVGGTNGSTYTEVLQNFEQDWTGTGTTCNSGGICAPDGTNDLSPGDGEGHSHNIGAVTTLEPKYYALAFILRLK